MSSVHKSMTLYCQNADNSSTAHTIADRFGLEFSSKVPISEDFHLEYIETGLSLHSAKFPHFKPLCLDFSSGKTAWRRIHGGGRGQAIAKAIGIKPKASLKVIDATTGLGQDSFVLASLGCEVYMIERSPVIAALLSDALARASQDHEIAPIIAKMHLHCGEAKSLIPSLPKVDAIYLDPMFPHDKKSALAKKEMQLLQALLGDSDESELLPISLLHAKRVVVKRPKNGPYLNNLKPTLQMIGSSNRFDIYF
jgi:16S rRNA (guanine1516-N2)-methyltransferase